MAVRDRSRYFCIEVDEALDYSGDDIIKAIRKRYPQTNYIRVRGKNDWNKKLVDGVWIKTAEYCWKIVWIQQTQNALDRDTVVRSLLKDMPGTQIMKRVLDDQEVSDTATQFVAAWGEFHPPALREADRKKLKAEQSITDMSDEDIARLVQENMLLKKEMAIASATLDHLVNSGPIEESSVQSSTLTDENSLFFTDRAAHTKAARKLPESIKKAIAGRQNYQCANSPGSNRIPRYKCDRWLIGGGNFNQSGYDIDHIIEVADGGGNDITNLQALCPGCHRVKTNTSSRNRVVSRNSK